MSKITKDNEMDPIVIVVLQRGWVYVGRRREDGVRVVLYSQSCIRRWGTTKGLGELVKGPTKNTILEPAVKPLRYNELMEIFAQDVDQEGWSDYCKHGSADDV